MNISTTKSVLISFGLTLAGLIIWFVVSNWKNKVTLKENCFKPFKMEVTDALISRPNAIWDSELRKDTYKIFWNVPSIVRLPMYNSEEEKTVIKFGYTGYLFHDSSENNAIPLDRGTFLNFSGDLIETKYTWLSEAFAGEGIMTSVTVLINEEKFLVYDFLLKPEVFNKISGGVCSTN